MQADQIYQLVKTAFSELGVTEPIRRSVLLRDRHFVGQRFRCGDFHAVWLAGSDRIEVTDAEGRPLKTISLEEPLKKAA
jgi:hypothetical protein